MDYNLHSAIIIITNPNKDFHCNTTLQYLHSISACFVHKTSTSSTLLNIFD